MKIRKLDRAAVRLLERRSEIDLRVFLGGPFINPVDPAPEPGAYGGAQLLRHRLFHFLKDELQCVVDIGESEKILDIYREQLEEEFEVSTSEFMHVRDVCNAVVIIPSSPGSFCELGFFSASNQICSKMLILLDKKFDVEPGYLHFGPVLQAKLHGATANSFDFSDEASVFDEVEKFVRRITVKMMTKDTRLS